MTPKGTFFFRAKNPEVRKAWINNCIGAQKLYAKALETVSGNAGPVVDDSSSSDEEENLGRARAKEVIGLGDLITDTETRAKNLLGQISSLQSRIKDPALVELSVSATSLMSSLEACLTGVGGELERRIKLEGTVLELQRQLAGLKNVEGPPSDNEFEDDEEDDEDDDDDSGGEFFDAAEEVVAPRALQHKQPHHQQPAAYSAPPAPSTPKAATSTSSAPTTPTAASSSTPTSSSSSALVVRADDYRGPLSHSFVTPVRENNTGSFFHRFPSHGRVAWRDRLSAPRPSKADSGASLWALLKNAVGKDLSRITLPAYYNEPLTMTERAAEELESVHLLDKAVACKSSLERIKYIATWAMSAYHATFERPGKPFNSLLGETFEWDRTEDMGYRFFSEQVSHHPPITALHCVHPEWIFSASSQFKSKFWGNSLEFVLSGTIHLFIPRYNEHYTWSKVTTSINSLLTDGRYVDHYGDLVVTNHQTGDTATVTFIKKGWLSGQFQLEGGVYDKDGTRYCTLEGAWNQALYELPPQDDKERKRKRKEKDYNLATDPTAKVLWRAPPRPGFSKEYYSLTAHAMQINEINDQIRPFLAPTDARFRPDQRALENGDAKGATEEKLRLEEKQRGVRRAREAANIEWEPVWFKKEYDPHSGTEGWAYKGGYWESRAKKDWSKCPDIY